MQRTCSYAVARVRCAPRCGSAIADFEDILIFSSTRDCRVGGNVRQSTRVAEIWMGFREFVFTGCDSPHGAYCRVHISQFSQTHEIPYDKPAYKNHSQAEYRGADCDPRFSLQRDGRGIYSVHQNGNEPRSSSCMKNRRDVFSSRAQRHKPCPPPSFLQITAASAPPPTALPANPAQSEPSYLQHRPTHTPARRWYQNKFRIYPKSRPP